MISRDRRFLAADGAVPTVRLIDQRQPLQVPV